MAEPNTDTTDPGGFKPTTPVLDPGETPVIDSKPSAPSSIPDYLQPAPQGTYDDATSKAAGWQQLKIDADEGANRQLNQRAEKLRQQQTYNINAEGWLASQVPEPWNADKERKERTTGPMEKFGSAAMVFAGIASAFSKTPAISALNAGAAVLTAINDGDEKAYREAHQAWKENTDLAIKRFNMQRDIYSDTNQLFDKDISLWKAKLIENATRFGDQQALNLLQHGQYPEFFKAEADRGKSMEAMLGAKEHFDTFELRRQAYKASVPEIDAALDPSDRRMVPLNAEARQLKQHLLAADPGSIDSIVGNKILDTMLREKRRPTPEEVAKFKVEAEQRLYSGSRSVTGGAGSTLTKATGDLEEKIYAQNLGKGMDPIEARRDAIQQAKDANASPLTGNQKQKIAEKQKTLDSIVNQIDRAKQLITSANAAGESVVGARGAFGRLKEFATGGGTYQSEFEELIRTIQREVKPIISGTTRLSKEDQKVIDTIVPGLGFLKNQEEVYAGLIQLQKILTKKDLLESDAPEQVEQNGWIYERQPDGSMKPLKKAQ